MTAGGDDLETSAAIPGRGRRGKRIRVNLSGKRTDIKGPAMLYAMAVFLFLALWWMAGLRFMAMLL